MTNLEKAQRFKKLYVDAHLLIETIDPPHKSVREDDVSKAIACIDEMLGLLPFDFNIGPVLHTQQPAMLLSFNDPAAIPEEKVVEEYGLTRYLLPDNTVVLRQATMRVALEDKKFSLWNYIVNHEPDQSIVNIYKPLMLAQAVKCLQEFPENTSYMAWEEDMLSLYANQIAWFAYLDENDPAKLEEVVELVKRGFMASNWTRHKYLMETTMQLLLKMGRKEEAWTIAEDGLQRDANDPDFAAIKADADYQHWAATRKQNRDEKEKAYQQELKAARQKATNHFINPDHPLVKQHAALLNLIKQQMVELRFQFEERDYALRTWTLNELEAFEQKTGLTLPDEYKVYLMEVGSGGGNLYFQYDDIIGLDNLYGDRITTLKKPFPITTDQITNLGQVPAGAYFNDGCMLLGYSANQNELYLVMNGKFADEVWADTLHYSEEAGGYFGAATDKRLKLLAFVAESLQANIDGYENASDEGDWM